MWQTAVQMFSQPIPGITMYHETHIFLLTALAFALLIAPELALAQDVKARTSDTLTVYLENDFLQDTDRYYTHGSKISWVSRDLLSYRDAGFLPVWMETGIKRLPWINHPGRRYTVSLSFGQNIYTPDDKEQSALIPDDRPYAGITYLGIGLHSRSALQMDTLELNFGIIGPHSYAEDCQKTVHHWTDSADARGWTNQLHDEPIVNVYFERKWKILKIKNADGLGLDCIPHAGLALGNAYIGTNMGGQLRLGWNIPNDFGTYLIRPGSDSSAPLDDSDPRFFLPFHRFGLHLFLAVDGKAVARNILLDGNTFKDSHSVSKKPFVADLIGGMGLIIHQVKITYSHVYRTNEFDTQKSKQHFGALSVSFTF